MASANMVQPFIGLQDPRIPFIRFEQRAVEKRTETGEVTYVDKDFVLITAQGSKDTTEKIVEEWFPQIKLAARDGAYPPGWIPRFEEMYRIWRETRQDPVDGTPVRNWPAISTAECKILLHAGVRSIEDLAEANEEFLGRIGMGARRLKSLAQDWVQANKSAAPLVAEMTTLRRQVEELSQLAKELKEENVRLGNKMAEQARQPMSMGEYARRIPSPEERLSDVQSASDEGDLIEGTILERLHG